MTDLWNMEKPITEYCENIIVPPWIDQDISPADVAAIVQGGCESGAYMPACTYHLANKTMAEWGDDVLDYIENVWGELPSPFDHNEGVSWSGIACFYLVRAVDTWASAIADEIEYELAA